MHWMSLHLLAAREGNLNVFVLGLHVVLGRGVAARGARVHWEWCYSVSFCCLFFFFFLLLLLLLLVGKGVAARGGNLKKTSWRGVGGEGAAPPLQMHWMSLHLLAAREGNLNVFVLGLHVVLARGIAARGAWVHWEWCYSVS